MPSPSWRSRPTTRSGSLPSDFAAQSGHTEVLRFLYEVAPGTRSSSGVHFASMKGQGEVLRLLHQLVPVLSVPEWVTKS